MFIRMFRQYAQDSLRRKLAVYSRGGADLMAGSFDGTALVPGNMAGFRCDCRFMRTQKSGQRCQVYLCAAFQKMDIHILPANFLPEKISRMPMNYFDTKPVGEVLSRVTNDVDTLGQSLNQSATQMITSVTTLIGVLVMMLSISWQMTLMALVVIPLSLFLVTTVVKHSQKYFAKQQRSLGNVNGHIEEMYSGHIVMKAFNGEEKSIAQFAEYNDELYDSAWNHNFLVD